MFDQPQVRLKRKVTLRRKEEAAFTFTGRLKVRLLWQSETDPDWQSETELDFCLFFKKKDGEVGGVFSDEYRHCMSDRGALDQFPYILHLGDPRKPSEIRAMLANYPEGKMEEVEQIIKQLNRQIDVIRVRDITDHPHLEREVILVKVSAPAEKRAEILAIIQPFRATVVDVAPSSITIQMTGNAEKSEALLRVIRPYGIRNIARTGATGFTRD